LIGIEACGGARYLARELTTLGHILEADGDTVCDPSPQAAQEREQSARVEAQRPI
jgi:hypothetical protein